MCFLVLVRKGAATAFGHNTKREGSGASSGRFRGHVKTGSAKKSVRVGALVMFVLYVHQDETCSLLLLIKSDPNRWLFSIVAGILAHSVAEDAQLCFSMAVYGIVSSVVLYPCLLHLNTKEARFECTLLLRRALFSKTNGYFETKK